MRFLYLIVCGFLLFTTVNVSAVNVSAEVSYRGFQLNYRTLDEATVKELAEEWNINLVRFQVGNDAIMDGLEGSAYDQMLLTEFALVNNSLKLLEKYGIKVILSLYSPPGGYATRTLPAHHKIFSEPTLQAKFIQTWTTIVQTFGGNSAIYAFDLLNEPASRRSLLCTQCRKWGQLARETVAAIRSVSRKSTIMLKPLYGNPRQLSNLPVLRDKNVIYGYHLYPFFSYQHAGIDNFPSNVARPKERSVKTESTKGVQKFFTRMKKQFDRGRIPTFPPRLSVVEFGVSGCSLNNPGEFLNDILTYIERDDINLNATALSKNSLKLLCESLKLDNCSALEVEKSKVEALKSVVNSNSLKPEIQHESWINHAFNDANVWDPRYYCDPSSKTFIKTGETDRSTVLKKFFERNK
jgi:hypothetical protein